MARPARRAIACCGTRFPLELAEEKPVVVVVCNDALTFDRTRSKARKAADRKGAV